MVHTVIVGGLMQKLETVKNLFILVVKETQTILRPIKSVRTIVETQEVNHNAFRVQHLLILMEILLFVVARQLLLAQHVQQIIIAFMTAQHMDVARHKVLLYL